MSFFEASAKKDIGVSEAFACIAKLVVDRLVKDGRGGTAAGPAGGAPVKVDAAVVKEKKGCCGK